MHKRFKKYFLIINIGIQHLLVYRARSAVWFLLDIFTMFIMPFVWLAAYGDAGAIEGFNRQQIVSYFLGVVVIQTAIASHLEERMRTEIKNGEFSNLLIKPVPHFAYMLLRELGWRVSYSLHLIPLFAFALIFFREYLYVPHDVNVVILTCVALMLAAFLFSILNYLLGLTALYFVEARSAADFFWVMLAMFSGTFAPLVFFPQWFQTLAEYLPFKYLIDFPLSLYLGTIASAAVAKGFSIMVFWIIVVCIACRVFFRKGVRVYEGVGL